MQDEREATTGLKRMSEFRDYEVSEEDPDPRGWTAVTSSGARIGEVKDLLVDPAALKVRFFEVEVDDGSRINDPRVLVDAYNAEVLERERQVVVTGDVATLASAGSVGRQAEVAHDREIESNRREPAEAARLTRAEEELHIGKREVPAGEVIVNKTVETEPVHEAVERRVERVRVDRRPVQATAMGNVEIGEREIRVPIVEEEVVVEKRPVVREEIVVTRDAETETEVIDTEVRKERVDIEENRAVAEGGRHGRH